MGRRLFRPGADGRERTLLLAGLLFTGAGLLLPLHTRAWEFFCVRFTPFGIVLLAVLLPLEQGWVRRGWRSGATFALLLFAVASIAWSWRHHQTTRQDSDDLLAGLRAPIRRQSIRLPLILQPPPGEDPDEWRRAVPYVTSNAHIAELYALVQGGVSAFSFAGLTGQSLAWREPPESWMPPRPERGLQWHMWEPGVRDNPGLRLAAMTHYLSFAPGFEDVILHARSEDAALLGERGFVIDFKRGELLLARFRGCPFTVTVAPPPEGPTPTLVTFGWLPSHRATFTTVLLPDTNPEPRRVTIPRSPCGEVWVRVLYDVDRDGKQSAPNRTCSGADANAVLVHRVRPFPEGDFLSCLPGPTMAH
jgi:hypothetical protein